MGKRKEGLGGNIHRGEKRWSTGAEGTTGTQSHLTWESCADVGLKAKASKRMKAQAYVLLLVCNREGPGGCHPQPSVPTWGPWHLPTARCLMRASDLLSRSLPGLIKSLLGSHWPLLPITYVISLLQLNTQLQLTSEAVLKPESIAEQQPVRLALLPSRGIPHPPASATAGGCPIVLPRQQQVCNELVHTASKPDKHYAPPSAKQAPRSCREEGAAIPGELAVAGGLYSPDPPRDHGCSRRRWFCRWQIQSLPDGCGRPPCHPARPPPGRTSALSCKAKAELPSAKPHIRIPRGRRVWGDRTPALPRSSPRAGAPAAYRFIKLPALIPGAGKAPPAPLAKPPAVLGETR